MPTIPSYKSPRVQQRSVSGATYSANATPQQFGAGIGRALNQAGQVVAQNATRMKREDDQAKVKAQLNEFRQRLNERTYLDEDGYYNRKGMDAYETFTPMLGEFDEIKSSMAEGLSESQLEMFNAAADQYVSNEHQQMSRYASAERTNWLNDQDQAVIEQAQADGALRYMDNGKYVAQMDQALVGLSQRNGWSEERLSLKREEYVSAMHVQALDSLFVKAPGAAEDYYETHKDSISVELRDNIETQIKLVDDAVWVEEQASVLRLGGGSRTERMKAINEMTDDPERRKKLRAQADYDMAQEKRAEQEMATEAYDDAYSSIIDTAGPGISPVKYQADNPELWEAMTPAQRTAISNQSGMDGKAIETDPVTYNQALGMLYSGKTKQADAVDFVLNNQDKLANGDVKWLLNAIHSSGGSGSSSESKKNPLNAEAKSQFNDWIETTLGKEPTDGKDRQRYNQREYILRGMYVNSLSPENTYDDRRILLDRLTTTVKWDTPKWWDGDRTASDEIFDMPIEKLQEYQEHFDRIGVPMTADDLQLVVGLGVDFTNPDYTEAARGLRELGVNVTVGNILKVVGYNEAPATE